MKRQHPTHHLGRELSVKPRRTGYKHRDIIAVVGDLGVTEHGEVVYNLPLFASSSDPHIWVIVDPATLLTTMLGRFRTHPAFNFQVVESTEPDVCGMKGVAMSRARLSRFGFSKGRDRRAPGRHRGMHLVWNPYDMSRAPGDFLEGNTHRDLLKFAIDVRDWCKQENIPLPTSLAGIASALSRDSRFWPDARGRVPSATNERVRPWLPGVYQELRAHRGRTYAATAIDQRSAYHQAAQEVPTPDPTTMFARGYFLAPETSPIWCKPDDELFTRTLAQPGVVYVSYSAPHPRKHETHLPAITPGTGRAALWTNEVQYALDMGVTIHGIVAAWTSCDADTGLPLYGAWASERISEADTYRKRWLKPTLHAMYGLLAMRTRQVHLHYHRARGDESIVVLGNGHEYKTRRREIVALPMPTTNVATLGVLQSEIRARSFHMANALSMEGATVLHIHADGIHVDGQLPLITNAWSIEPLTNLIYLDRVSWLSDQGDTLPGRADDAREAIREAIHVGRLTAISAAASR